MEARHALAVDGVGAAGQDREGLPPADRVVDDALRRRAGAIAEERGARADGLAVVEAQASFERALLVVVVVAAAARRVGLRVAGLEALLVDAVERAADFFDVVARRGPELVGRRGVDLGRRDGGKRPFRTRDAGGRFRLGRAKNSVSDG